MNLPTVMVWFRRTLIPLFRVLNPGNVSIRHHYTQKKLLLHSFRHKGYWFHGKRRERSTFDIFEQTMDRGETVIEVGGHIGYFSTYFAFKVGSNGKVFVFEPGPNNLPYLRVNIVPFPQIELVEKAVMNKDCKVKFFIEDLTGQNNTLLPDYVNFKKNLENAGAVDEYREIEVDGVKLDTFTNARAIRPDWVKIDVEGAEILVLEGMKELLETKPPKMMIEVTRDSQRVKELLDRFGLVCVAPDEGRVLKELSDSTGNIFCFHPEYHKSALDKIGLR